MTAPLPKPSILVQLAEQGDKEIETLTMEEDNRFATVLAIFYSKIKSGKIDRTALLAAINFLQNPTQSNAAGTLPAAIGTGRSPEDERNAMQVLVNSNQLSIGQKRALQRVLAPRDDKEFLAVDSDGTSIEVALLKKQVSDLTGDKLSLEKNLADTATALADSKKNPPNTMLTSIIQSTAEDINTILEKGKTKVGFVMNEAFVLPKDDHLALVEKVESLRAIPATAPKPTPPPKK